VNSWCRRHADYRKTCYSNSSRTVPRPPVERVASPIPVVDTVKSNDSDKTLSGTGSSDSIGTAYRLDSQDSTTSVEGDGTSTWSSGRQMSIREWDIPYEELKIGDKIGTGRFSTVPKMELPCEYDGCDVKFKGDNLGQSIDLLKIHIGAKHHRASEGQGGGGESIKKKMGRWKISEEATERNNLADRLNAHFMTSTVNFHQKTSFYQPFFKEVYDTNAKIEKAFSLDDRLSGRLDDSGEGTLERPLRQQPLPPPRIDSYIRAGPPSLNSRSGSGRSESGSEIYERLPDSGSHGDELEVTASDDSDVYSHVDSLDREGQRPTPPHNGTHLAVKPSQIKSRRKQVWRGPPRS